jgi:pyruvate formate lyase activating enzyme
MFEKVLKKINWVGFDIKAPFEEAKYQKAIGGINHLKNVQKSLDLLLASGLDFECRTTCDPSILEVEDIYTIADTLHAMGVKKYHLQRYQPIKGDPVKEYHCDKFVKDKDLATYLRSKFQIVELRS